MKKIILDSIEELDKYLSKNKCFTFSSTPKKLSHAQILLFALATRDFNPAHIVSGFADKSIFKGIVSHGIGTVSRAEATYVEMVRFKEPVELIAMGYEDIKYYKPLRLNSVYQYDYSISNLRSVKNRWDFDCHVVCKVIDLEVKVVAEWTWKTCYIKSPELSLSERKMLVPKSYFWNVFNHIFFQPVTTLLLMVIGFGGIFSGLTIIILQLTGVIPIGTTDVVIMGP